MCDLAYVMLLENWQAQALADRQALIVRGSKELPTFGTAQSELDRLLAAEPVEQRALSVAEHELRQVLGVLK